MEIDEAFLSAIEEDPDDPTDELIYSDWLEDRDDPRAVPLRLRNELEQMEYHERDYRRLAQLSADYRTALETCGSEWVARLGRIRPWITEETAIRLLCAHLRAHFGWRGDYRWLRFRGESNLGWKLLFCRTDPAKLPPTWAGTSKWERATVDKTTGLIQSQPLPPWERARLFERLR